MSFVFAHILSICTRMPFVISRMYSYVICMSLVCTRMPSLCHSYVLVCHPCFTRMYSYVIRMSLVCTRMSSVCHSYVLVCHPYVTRKWFYYDPSKVSNLFLRDYYVPRDFHRDYYIPSYYYVLRVLQPVN